jgi:regulator of protease activity HflC (stomatin/prohibitin superfamily)
MTNLVKTAQLKGALSKEQKRFNGYLQKIKTLKEQIELSRELALELSRMVQEKVNPTEEKMLAAWKELILSLDRSMFVPNLTPKQYDKYEAIVFEHADSYLGSGKIDEDIKAIFDKHSEDSFDDMTAEGEEHGKEYLIEMLKHQFGIDIDPDEIQDINNPFNNPSIIEKIQAAQEEQKKTDEEKAQQRAEFEANRPKSDKQIEKEARKKAAETAVSKTTKQIYMDLVRNFHPDTEQDETKRLWKTQIMQQITVAYNDDDYIKLLELQMTLLEDRDNAVEKFNDKELKYFNDALKQQVDDLQMQLQMNSPAMNPMFPGAELFSLNRDQMLRNINSHVKDLQKNLKIYRNVLEHIRTMGGFKDYVKRYELNDEMDFDMGMMMDMMRMMKR